MSPGCIGRRRCALCVMRFAARSLTLPHVTRLNEYGWRPRMGVRDGPGDRGRNSPSLVEDVSLWRWGRSPCRCDGDTGPLVGGAGSGSERRLTWMDHETIRASIPAAVAGLGPSAPPVREARLAEMARLWFPELADAGSPQVWPGTWNITSSSPTSGPPRWRLPRFTNRCASSGPVISYATARTGLLITCGPS